MRDEQITHVVGMLFLDPKNVFQHAAGARKKGDAQAVSKSSPSVGKGSAGHVAG